MPESLVHVFGQFNVMLLGFAAMVGAITTIAALGLFDRSRSAAALRSDIWLNLAAVSMGFGIWATHFLGMLAFEPYADSGYAVTPIVASLLGAIVVSHAAFTLMSRAPHGRNAIVGGAILGAGTALAQLGGMTAFHVAGSVTWVTVPAAASILIGALLCCLAVSATTMKSAAARVSGASVLGVAPFLIHGIAILSLDVHPDPTVALAPSLVPPDRLAVVVAIVTFVLVSVSVLSTMFDLRNRQRRQRESELRALADAAVEGLTVCDGDLIVSVNSSLVRLCGLPSSDVTGKRLGDYVTDDCARARLLSDPDAPVETDWVHRDGSLIPVEIISHAIDFAGRSLMAFAVRDLRDRRKAEQKILFLAHHDALTGLDNRSTFNARLDSAIELARRSGHKLAVLCLDLDRFKEVNDLFGHVAGDQMLQRAAERVTGVLGTDMALARIGGDEFAVVVPKAADAAQAGEIADAILDALQPELSTSAGAAMVSCSIGIALYPNDGIDRQALLNHADTALQRAKLEGRGTYRFFEAAMGVEVRERRLMEHDLRHAVPRRELAIVYQPQSVVATGEIIGFEALLRWLHPDRGNVPPSLFIPIAEESGAIVQIGEWVLKTVCLEAATWPSRLRVGVNVSAVQLHSPDFPAMVQATLHEIGLNPDRLELEITETALVRDFDRALAALLQLKAIGVRISMDDFGTGYSSLSNLRAFPFDRIKIDRSFVSAIDHNDQSAAIVRAVLGLGRGLNLPILAEGVETAAELQFLNDELCQEAQGYLLGRPAPIGAFRSLTHPVAIEPASASSRIERAGMAA